MATPFKMQDYANAWNTHNVDRIMEFYADDAELVDPSMPTPARGREAIRENVKSYLTAFPDLNGAVEWSVEQSGKVAALVRVTGTHSGAFDLGGGKSIAATNKKVTYPLGGFYELTSDGRIKREVDTADMLTVFAQLGLRPDAIPWPTQTGTPARAGR